MFLKQGAATTSVFGRTKLSNYANYIVFNKRLKNKNVKVSHISKSFGY